MKIHQLDEWTVEQIPDVTPELRLVVHVIDRALRDLGVNGRSVKLKERREALAWFDSDSVDPWSFLWCCSESDISPAYIRSLFSLFENGDPYGFKKRVSARKRTP